jgi:hypothetical protein
MRNCESNVAANTLVACDLGWSLQQILQATTFLNCAKEDRSSHICMDPI